MHGPERGIIAQVKENPAAQFFIFDYGPAATAGGVQFVLTYPGEFDPLETIDDRPPARHLSPDQPELKTPGAVLFKCEVPWHF